MSIILSVLIVSIFNGEPKLPIDMNSDMLTWIQQQCRGNMGFYYMDDKFLICGNGVAFRVED
jgi:hypothetical protein